MKAQPALKANAAQIQDGRENMDEEDENGNVVATVNMA